MAQIIKGIEDDLLSAKDMEFIEHIDKSYKLRYPNNLDSDFELYIPSLKVLENLDRGYCNLNKCVKITELNPDKKMFDVYVIQKNPSLFNSNVYFDPTLVNIISESNQKYAYYKYKNGIELQERFRWSEKIKSDDGWYLPVDI